MQKIIEIKDGVVRHPDYRMNAPVNFELLNGEHLAIVGDNGSGKSLLVDILTGKRALMPMHEVRYDFSPGKARMVSDNIKHLTFFDSYGTNEGVFYYQQRWNQNDIDETPLVRDLLEQSLHTAQEAISRQTVYDKFLIRDETPEEQAERLRQQEIERRALCEEMEKMRDRLYHSFNLEKLLDKRIILLSSGELRKFQLAKTLLQDPRVLILDNPFIGLDAGARQQLDQFLTLLTRTTHITLVLTLSKTDDIPDFITHVVPMVHKTVGSKITLKQYRDTAEAVPATMLSPQKRQAILDLPTSTETPPPADPVIQFHDVTIRYDKHVILNKLNLTVLNGQHWALNGENGAGKSTLLSLVCADNPQAYANHITLFGKKRGTGESIWDIKRHIGYVSPEMHRACQRPVPAVQVVSQGLPLYSATVSRSDAQKKAMFWMEIFGIDQYANTPFTQLSSGEQRLVLLARAFVGDPSLLILDEPFHGLDLKNRRLAKDVIETFCQRPHKTLLMVTHYREEYPSVIDHELYLKRQAQ